MYISNNNDKQRWSFFFFFNSKQTPQSPTQQPAALTDAKQNVEVKVEAPKTPTVEESKPPMPSSSSLLGDTATKDTEKAWTEKVRERSKAEVKMFREM